MRHDCFETQELIALTALPADDARRREAAGCPRCDSQMRAIATFLAGDDTLSAAELRSAEQRLAGVLAEQAASRVKPRSTARRSRPVPRWGWGLGLAAAIGVIMLVTGRESLAPSGPSGVLRGGAAGAGAAVDLPVTRTAGPEAQTERLAWPPVPGATGYQLEIFTAALDTLGIIGPVAEPAATVDAVLLNPGSGGKVLYRVRAFGATGEILTSRLTALPLR